MKIKQLKPACNLQTILDGRGGILTWDPGVTIAEWNFMYFNSGKIRGNHYHPEFDEFILIVFGMGVMVTRDSKDAPLEYINLGRSDCVHIPKGIPHAFLAITECSIVSFNGKRWADCKTPVVHEELLTNVEEVLLPR